MIRLLQLKDGEFNMVAYDDAKIPPYAILSHRWEGEEVTYEDLQDNRGKRREKSYRKLTFCGEQAAKDGLDHFWLDTCCIDKSSSAELTESLNSMFKWYQNSAECYIYLADVSIKHPDDFQKSAWFTRGWTLQELIAPKTAKFFSVEGDQLGTRESLEHKIVETTGIPAEVLQGVARSQFTIEQRKSWQKARTTTREEDMAYSLLGILGVSMPVIYGEGRQQAFKRLERAIQQDEKYRVDGELMNWLSPTNFPIQQSDNIERRQEGTGQWFLDHSEFTTWISQPSGTLFCSGHPGVGKTMIAAIAIDHLVRTKANASIGVAYAYCIYNSQSQQNTADLLAAILKQLVQSQPSLVEPVKLLHEEHINRGTKASLQEIYHALQSVIKGYSTIYIVIDALDEIQDTYGTRHQLFTKLQGLQKVLDVRLMVTSRSIPDIMDYFQTALRVEVHAAQDVKRFVAGQIDLLHDCIKEDEALKNTVLETIVEAVADVCVYLSNE